MAETQMYARVTDECPRCGERNFAWATRCIPCEVSLVQWVPVDQRLGLRQDVVDARELECWLREYGEVNK